MIHFNRFLWAIRKLSLPVNKNSIVLDVGSGGNPHPRSDVLLDRVLGAEHRSGTPMVIDRLTVLGDANKLPFKDKSFDFIIASHILEHMENPEIFISELMRVGKAGYIETPNFICERLTPCLAHCLEIANIDGVLHINKKNNSIPDLFFFKTNFLNSNSRWKSLFYKDPFLFHTRYFWTNEIKYKIFNPHTKTNWINSIYNNSETSEISTKSSSSGLNWRSLGSFIFEFFEKKMRSKRMQKFDIYKILVCPECKGDLEKSKESLSCINCNIQYSNQPYINFDEKIC